MVFIWQPRDHVRITLQTDHMAQAGDVGAVWGNGKLPPPRDRVAAVTAARHHDEGWRRFELAPDMDHEAGLPVDFRRVDRRKHAAFYGGGVDFVEPIEPHAALLISMHATGLYLGRYGVDGMPVPDRDELPPHSRAFVDGEERRQARLKEAMGVSDADVWHDYRLLQVWDRLSIVFCHGMDEATLGPVPTDDGSDGPLLRVRRVDTLTVEMDPYPFQEPEHHLPARTFVVPHRRYRSWVELNEVLCATPAEMADFRVVPARGPV